MRNQWETRAACRDEDATLWFVENAQLNAEAIRICSSCPVKAPCLESALERRERFGIWGGRKMGQLEREDFVPAPWQIVERKRRTA